MQPLLEVVQLARPGLEPVSFALASGECIAVRGPSGSGKTLLLRALADLDPSSGEVALDGASRAERSGPEWRSAVGYLAAEPGWWSERVAQHFDDWSRAAPLAERLGLTATIGDEPVARLSTGERGRLALVRTLLRAPRVLLLDEPTAGLDEATTRAVEGLVAERLAQGVGVLWVTHDAAQAGRVATRVLSVEGGRVREGAA
jgi:phosphate-transporting ATPase